jgi:DNA-binding LytR/AlgR family response regulator
MTITALIAEDEAPIARDLAHRLSKAWPELQIVATANNGLEALEKIEELKPAIAFLDINMPGLTGLQVARQLEHRPHIVFVTAYSEHAVEAFEHEAIDYLLKPVQDDRLHQGKLPSQERFLTWIRAGVGNTIHNIAIDDVLYFEAEDKYTRVVTRTLESLVRVAISELEAQLNPETFQRIHRGTIVNLHAIKAIHKNDLGALELVIDGRKETLAVSRAHAGAFRQM